VTRDGLAVLASTGAVAIATAAAWLSDTPARLYAASPAALADGRIWLLATSALVADKPIYASLLGFAVVGLAAVYLCGSRVVWLAAASGHIVSAVVVYVGIGLVRLADSNGFAGALTLPDFGTSAIIAAWIGAIAYVLWTRGARTSAVALCVAAALVGWYFKGRLTILDTEHAVALACGIAAMRYAPMLRVPRLRPDGRPGIVVTHEHL
jgi:hypothetical protein